MGGGGSFNNNVVFCWDAATGENPQQRIDLYIFIQDINIHPQGLGIEKEIRRIIFA